MKIYGLIMVPFIAVLMVGIKAFGNQKGGKEKTDET